MHICIHALPVYKKLRLIRKKNELPKVLSYLFVLVLLNNILLHLYFLVLSPFIFD